MANSRIFHIRFLIAALAFFLAASVSGNSYAKETEQSEEKAMGEAKEIVFLLDASESMRNNDPGKNTAEGIAQLVYSLPGDSKIGFAAYNTNVCASQGLSDESGRDGVAEVAGNTVYEGYSNAGAGLKEAVSFFSEEDKEKFIIMFSDGEIDMPDKEQAEEARNAYVEAANRAKEKGIKIYIIAIGNELESKMHIFDGAELTGGAVYWENQSSSLSGLLEKIAAEQLGIPRQALGVTDAGGGNVHAKLPPNAGHIKIIVTSDTTLSDVKADYSAQEGRVIFGTNYAVADMERPDSQYADIHFRTENIAGVQAYMLVEYDAMLKTDVAYRIEEIPGEKEETPSYEHFADITIRLQDSMGVQENLWDESFEGKEIPIKINDVSDIGCIKNGQIQLTVPAEGIEEIKAEIEMESEDAVYYIEQPAVGQIEKYPDPEPEKKPDYRPLWGILILLALSVFTVVLWWVKKKNTTVIYMSAPRDDSEKKIETKNCTYSGRFTMYVVRNKDGRDIPPQTYVLFGKAPTRVSLDKILNSCGIKCGKIGAEDIIFYPGPDHSVILMDQSERCTVMRGTEIVKKGMGYPIFYNEKITVAFEDEMTEMEIHYKNISPGERNKATKI